MGGRLESIAVSLKNQNLTVFWNFWNEILLDRVRSSNSLLQNNNTVDLANFEGK